MLTTDTKIYEREGLQSTESHFYKFKNILLKRKPKKVIALQGTNIVRKLTQSQYLK